MKKLHNLLTGYTMLIAILIEIISSTATFACLISAIYTLYNTTDLLKAFAFLIFGCVFGFINYKMGGN